MLDRGGWSLECPWVFAVSLRRTIAKGGCALDTENVNVEEDDLLGGGVAECGICEAAEIFLIVLHEEPVDVAATGQRIACRNNDVSAQSGSRPPSKTQAD